MLLYLLGPQTTFLGVSGFGFDLCVWPRSAHGARASGYSSPGLGQMHCNLGTGWGSDSNLLLKEVHRVHLAEVLMPSSAHHHPKRPATVRLLIMKPSYVPPPKKSR